MHVHAGSDDGLGAAGREQQVAHDGLQVSNGKRCTGVQGVVALDGASKGGQDDASGAEGE